MSEVKLELKDLGGIAKKKSNKVLRIKVIALLLVTYTGNEWTTNFGTIWSDLNSLR